MSRPELPKPPCVAVVIPARDEEARIASVVRSVLRQRPDRGRLEVIVVDDGSCDETGAEAREAGATVLRLGRKSDGGNPARARNRGAAESRGDPIVFLDADCTPRDGWLERLLEAHRAGAEVVGGALALPAGLSLTARCDYYCGWYHFHPKRPAGPTVSLPPCNLSVRRAVFQRTRGFFERHPVAYAHEELEWQSAVRRSGGLIYFEPAAIVEHHNRSGFWNLLRRSYRWGYSAIEAKAESRAARFQSLYRYPVLLIAASGPLALMTTVYLIACWLRAGVAEPLLLWPLVLASRLAYSAGLAIGGIRIVRGQSGQRRPVWE